MIINIRGTNGSGKTFLARQFQDDNCSIIVNLVSYPSPTKKEPEGIRFVTGVVTNFPGLGEVCCVGSYTQNQGGMDTIPSFELQQLAVREAAERYDHVICEGVLASTVAGSWLEFFSNMKLGGFETVICYLDTPLGLCLDRIKARQERAGKVREIKRELVADKVKSIEATRKKFFAAGFRTFTLFTDEAEVQLHRIMGADA